MTEQLLPEKARRIIDAAAKQRGLVIKDILGTSRRQDVAFARFVAIEVLHRYGGFSGVQVASLVNRDRASVIYARKEVAERGDMGACVAYLLSYLREQDEKAKQTGLAL